MTMTTAVAAVLLVVLGACGAEEEPGGSASPSGPSSSPSASDPSPSPVDSAGAPETTTDLAGEWQDVEAEWRVRFNPDGTFTEDYQGVTDFRTGTYTLEDGVVTLEGDDGNSTEGRVEGTALAFRLGTLQRM